MGRPVAKKPKKGADIAAIFMNRMLKAGYKQKQAQEIIGHLNTLRSSRGAFDHEQLDVIIRLAGNVYEKDVWNMLERWSDLETKKTSISQLTKDEINKITKNLTGPLSRTDWESENLYLYRQKPRFPRVQGLPLPGGRQKPRFPILPLPGGLVLGSAAMGLFSRMYDQLSPPTKKAFKKAIPIKYLIKKPKGKRTK